MKLQKKLEKCSLAALSVVLTPFTVGKSRFQRDGWGKPGENEKKYQKAFEKSEAGCVALPTTESNEKKDQQKKV